MNRGPPILDPLVVFSVKGVNWVQEHLTLLRDDEESGKDLVCWRNDENLGLRELREEQKYLEGVGEEKVWKPERRACYTGQ